MEQHGLGAIASRLPGEEQILAAIAQPAQIQGYNLQSGLLELILRDVEAEDNCLPLMEFALTELWEKRDSVKHELTVTEYTALGGLFGALDRHAEDIYQKLVARGQGEWVQRVMLRLVRTGSGMRDTRHRRSKTELLGMGADAQMQAKIEDTIDRLVDGRLLASDRVNDENIIDLSHERLMQGWQRFAKWRESDRDVRRLVDKIQAARREWQQQKQQGKYLLEGRLLGNAKRLLKTRSESLVGEARSFVEKSLQHQKWKRVRSTGWLIIPAFILGIPSEYFWHEEAIRQDYRSIENSQGTEEERMAVLNLAGGCWVKEQTKQYFWVDSYFRERMFGNCRSLQRTTLNGADLSRANLSGANLNSVSLTYANLSGAILSRANLSNAILSRANLSGADLSRANLSNSILSANLRVSGSDKSNVIDYLSGGDFLSANLNGVNLSYAILSGVDLSYSNLTDANLSYSNLTDANLSGADLSRTNLSFAKLNCYSESPCVNLENIKWDKETKWEGIKGWENVKNIPPELKKQLNLP